MTRGRCFVIMLAAAAAPGIAHAQSDPRAAIIGTWRGTSTCVDKAAFPSCHDEVVIYTVTAASARDSIVMGADRITNGARVAMGDLTLGRDARGDWVTELRTQGFRGRWSFHAEGARLTGELVDASGRRERAVSAQKS